MSEKPLIIYLSVVGGIATYVALLGGLIAHTVGETAGMPELAEYGRYGIAFAMGVLYGATRPRA